MTHLDDIRLQALADSGDGDPHITDCATCSDAVASYRRLSARLANLPSPPLTPDFAQNVMRAIAARELGTWTQITLIFGLALVLLFGVIVAMPLLSVESIYSTLAARAQLGRWLYEVWLSCGGVVRVATALALMVSAAGLFRILKEETI